ncbi:DUF3223 domain-containing protein [Pseudomonas sp. SWRI50]|uniref:DUF3223 domain-containing protein n=1 Tax=Pseudomonas sp. SWRI50 TaxID=2745484 RepID=UPI00164566D4|nr:DUF3223 domain-containing protein [Pseudomonas sp. SWRI50]MBC3487146.1 DUF3223 domain-containing protein [Pseudomonas sp. SWRI50]
MPYQINNEGFATKNDVRIRCRDILAKTPDGKEVAEVDADFLYSLFQYHDEWSDKSGVGVAAITTQTTSHGTRCFVLRRHCGGEVDISFTHAIKLMPGTRGQTRQPQGLLDFRAGARTAVNQQIRTFRDTALVVTSVCPVTGEPVNHANAAVDHVAPTTFDQLLYDFCLATDTNPLNVLVGSLNGVVATIEDVMLCAAWEQYHLAHAQLRLISKTGNLKLSKPSVPWFELYTSPK